MPSFQSVNKLYDQSYTEVLQFKDADTSSATLQKYSIIIDHVDSMFD
jgi:hypothetical protein